MNNIKTLINEMTDNDLHEMAVIAAGYKLFYVGDTVCAKFVVDENGHCTKFGPFEPLNNSEHCLKLVANTAALTAVVCVSVGAGKTMCEFVPEPMKLDALASMRRALVKGCIKKWMEHNHFQSVISMGDLHRRLVHRGLVDPEISK